ncbi:MAG TPA: molecular chaperone HtpG [Candidatus Mailhella merdavium]|nr:molecular chaperone HtpG [Candidatus Mailhella merdavium]
MAEARTRQFRAETRKVLNILTHSLYTNREIFLRELLSNASDALEKVRFLQSKGESVRDADLPLEIRITLDKDNKTLCVSDTGVGMTEEEMIENLGTIAKSGSEQFLKDMEKEAPQKASAEADNKTEGSEDEDRLTPDDAQPSDASRIIGHFGVGFYSVFMVADKVEVTSVSALGDGSAHVWASDGSGTFTIRALSPEEAKDLKRGTTVKASIREDATEFLEKFRIESVIRRHSNFLPFPILIDGERFNTTPALWREPKFSITREQYNDFYRYLTYDSKPPLDVIHLSVDAPVQFTTLIFIPDSEQDLFREQRDEWGLDLYVRRVLIAKDNRDLIPNYLAFLKGVVDTEDLPLNISRETLQENVVLRKISQTIVRQVLAHLERMAKNDKEKYAAFWKLHGKYFKFAFNDFVHRDRVAPLMRFATTWDGGEKGENELTSFDEYLSRMKPDQKNIWYIAAPSREAALLNPHFERFRRKGIEALILTEAVDEFALEGLGKYKDHEFKSVEQATSADLDAFPDVEEAAPKAAPLEAEDKESFDKLVARMKEILGDQVKDVRVSDRLAGSPALLASEDGVSSSMEKFMRVMQKDDSIPKKILELNPDHPLLRAMLRIFKADPDNTLLDSMTRNLFDNTLLLDGYLNDPYAMAERSLKLMGEAAGWYADLRKL